MSSTGNIYLQQNPGLERALVALRESAPAAWRTVMGALGGMQEDFMTRALATDGETGQRALGSAGAIRLLRTIARDADGKPFVPPKGEEEGMGTAMGGDE